MISAFDRTKALIGEENFGKLSRSHVLVVGMGGVGGAAAEVLVRAGVGHITFVDGDVFEPTNLNRQILCTAHNIGTHKAAAAVERAKAINPDIHAEAVNEFVSEKNIDRILAADYAYCIDAIDDVKNKILLVCACKARGIPVVSAMGAGNRTDCSFKVTDVFSTKYDPLARKLRHELKKCGIASLDVVCADTPPAVVSATPLSYSAPPFVMGAMLANHAVNGIISR